MPISLAEDIRSVTDLKAMNLGRLLSEAEAQVSGGQTRSARAFLKEFKNGRKL